MAEALAWQSCRDVTVILKAGGVHTWNRAQCAWTEPRFHVRLQDGQHTQFIWADIRQIAYTPEG